MNRVVFGVLLLAFCLPVKAQLNLSIMGFDAGIPEDQALHRDLQVFPKIREIESMFLPFVLRQALESSGDWGAVRVIPEIDEAAELLISGEITHSDGETLSIQLRAVDSRGHVWIDDVYTTTAGYEQLFVPFVADLRGYRDELGAETLRSVAGLSAMRHAAELAPDAFADYYEGLPDGSYRLLRLPADSDPMMERIERIRSVQYVMTDAIDQKYAELHDEVDTVYDIWRDYRRWYSNFQAQEAQRNELAEARGAPGSYEALRQLYDNYRLDRLASQEQEKWIVGFDNEMAPVIDNMQERIGEMNGWVEDEYAEWQRILAELFEIESGLE